MSYLQEVLNVLNSVPPIAWDTILGGIFLSPAMAGVKKWLAINNELVMTIYVIGGAAILATAAYLKDNPDAAPWVSVPIITAGAFLVSQPVYFAVVKPLKRHMAAWVEEANKLNEAKRSAALPADAPLPADFS